MTPEIALDLLLILMLGATVGYCVVLNARLGRLRDGQTEFKALVDTLTAATDKAESSLKELRELTESASKNLSKNITSARELADELAVVTESGNALAQRLEVRLTGDSEPPGRSERKVLSTVAGRDEGDDQEEPRSETEKELLTLLRNVR